MKTAELQGINYYRGSKQILREVNWQIETGQRWVVLGSNGSGKTTLASILAGYRGGYEGDVYLWGEKLTADNAVRLRQKIGFVSDSYFANCYKHELGPEIILGAQSGQLGAQGDLTNTEWLRAKHLLEALGVGRKGEYPFDLLSKGQQQKVLLARAFMPGSDFLVFDEALNGLDMISRRFVSNTLADMMHCSNITMVCITHHAEEILEEFTHALLLKNGAIHSQGNIKNVINSDNLSDFFACPVQCAWKNGHLSLNIGEQNKLPRSLWQKEEI